ncbi:MAG TPA: HAMP domain-containing sensor histidine kinase, partial [Chitinophagaceae bacterium]|nr:HAMP domain-containing sensor histidine kinase [Chitinophagaceae bacterium]
NNAPVYKDLIAQHTLLGMLAQLDILRTNIYGVLYADQLQFDSLANSQPDYSSYKALEKEFLAKASKEFADSYLWKKGSQDVSPMLAYIDRIFMDRRVDSVYSAEQWRQFTSEALAILKNVQDASLQKSGALVKQTYEGELQSKNNIFLILSGTIIMAVLLALYITFLIYKFSVKQKTASAKAKEEAPSKIQNKPAIEPDILDKPIDPGDRMVKPVQEDSYHEKFAPSPYKNGTEKIMLPENKEYSQEQSGKLTQKMKEDLIKLMLEKDKVRAEIHDMLKWKEDYLSVATHELKTPVASLKAYTHLLQTDAHEKGDITKEGMYAKMDLQVDKLNQLVNDLLDTTKIQNGKLVYHNQNFSFDRLVQSTVDEIQLRHPSHQIVVEKNVSVLLSGDRDRIAQVLGIILNNAIRFCPDVPLIIVRSETIENKVVCSVQDFGRGISKQHHHRIFEEFYRVEDNNVPTSAGLGLGLFIAKEVITAHRGKMWLRSREDEGSTFYFSIPVAKKQETC